MVFYFLEPSRPSLAWRVLVCLDAVAWPVGCYLVIAAYAGEVPLFLVFCSAMWALLRLRRALFCAAQYRPTTSKVLAVAVFLCALFVLVKAAIV